MADITFFVLPSMAACDERNGYIETFDEPASMVAYPAIRFLNHGTWSHAITVSSPVSGYPTDEDLRASWSLALSSLRRVVGEPQAWSLGDELIHNVDDIDYDTPVWAVDEETQAEWAAITYRPTFTYTPSES